MFKKIIFAAFILLATTACKESGTDSPAGNPNGLLKKETLGVYNGEDNLFLYDSEMYQYAYNTQRRTFRIQNAAQDRQMVCTLAAVPSVNQTMTLAIETQGISSLPSQEIQVQILKISGGKIWLWNNEKRLGFVIRLE